MITSAIKNLISLNHCYGISNLKSRKKRKRKKESNYIISSYCCCWTNRSLYMRTLSLKFPRGEIIGEFAGEIY